MLAIVIVSSLNGVAFHDYTVPIYTNIYGENWVELLLLVTMIPSVVWCFKNMADESKV